MTRSQGSTEQESSDAIGRRAHATSVLDTLVQQTCEIVGVERALIATRDHDDASRFTVVAGYGIPEAVLGRSFAIEQGMMTAVICEGKAALGRDDVAIRQTMSARGGKDLYAAGAVPIEWSDEVQGALCAVTTDPARLFGDPDLAVLLRLAGLGAVALEHIEISQRLERAVEASVEAMARAIAMRDSYTSRHSDDVVDLAVAVGERLGVTGAALVDLRFGARLHDLGKIGVPDAILHKAGPLERDEWEVVKQHPTIGAEMLDQVQGLEAVAEIVRAEHERWDGGGYPHGLRGQEIPLASRIVFACDAYDAMTTDRPYRRAMQPPLAVKELRDCMGEQFDPAVVQALVTELQERSANEALFGDGAELCATA